MVSEETSIFFGTLFYLIEVACVSVMQPNVIYLMKVLNTYINIQLMVVSLFTPQLSGVNSLKLALNFSIRLILDMVSKMSTF